MTYTELGPPGRILWVDALPDRLEAQDWPDEEVKVSGIEGAMTGKQKDPTNCCEIGHKLGERFATAARLYAEAVVVFTSSPFRSQDEYKRLREVVKEAQERTEATGAAYVEHVESHRCQRGA